jgi:DNA polymerase-3 subunit gamma/tau
LADTGRDIAQFLKDLEAHARDLLVVQTLGEVPHELRLTPDRDERLAEQAGRIPGSSLVRLLDLLAEALRTVKDGADARTRLEAALVKAAAPEVDPAARALMARVERLEAALSGAAPPQPLRAVAPPRAVPEVQPPAPAPTPPSPRSTTQAPEQAPGEAAGSAPEDAPGEAAGSAPEQAPGEAAGSAPEHAPGEAARSAPEPAPGEAAAGTAPEHAPGEGAGSAAEHAPQPTPTATALAEPDLDAVRTLWPAVLDAVRADNGLLAACLAEAHPVEVRGSEVIVAFAEHDTFNRKMADGREHRATVDDALRDLAGSSLRVVFELRELEERSEVKPPSEDELVARFKTEFDAEEIVPDDPQPDEPGGQN